jgi:uracil-DNA glycosylase family 4
MNPGFFNLFPSIPQQSAPIGLLPRCGACGLCKLCKSPKMQQFGEGSKKVLIVLNHPSEEDDLTGKPFSGEGEIYLRRILYELGINVRRDCWITFAYICYPGKQISEKIAKISMESCLPNLANTIKQLKPNVIIPLGNDAVKAVIRQIWDDDLRTWTRWVGKTIPCQKWNIWVCPSYDPFVVQKNAKATFKQDTVSPLFFRRHLKRAFELSESKPWKEVPDYRDLITVEFNPDKASREINKRLKFLRSDDLTSFDYETNALKPDHPKCKIKTCSICFEENFTIAFPWQGTAIEATKNYLQHPCRKVASNMKFEDRWTRAKLKIRVINWYWDTMIAAHVLDNTREITSVKFQAFVLLGVPLWNKHIEPFFEASGDSCYDLNRIDEIDLHELLVYNGLDSFLELLVAKIQMQNFVR